MSRHKHTAFIAILILLYQSDSFGNRQYTGDSYILKKSNLSLYLMMAPMGMGTAGPQCRYSRYFRNWLQMEIETSYGVVNNTQGAFVPEAKPYRYFQSSIELDWHLYDKGKERKGYIKKTSKQLELDTQNSAYVEKNMLKRRVLAAFVGFQYWHDHVTISSLRETNASRNTMPLYNVSKGREELLPEARISTNVVSKNFILGLKFKHIIASKWIFDDESSIKDIHLETYVALLKPISYSYENTLHYAFQQPSDVYQIQAHKVKPGFKIGLIKRSSISNHWGYGLEVGVRPNISMRYLNGTYIAISLGYSFSFGRNTFGPGCTFPNF